MVTVCFVHVAGRAENVLMRFNQVFLLLASWTFAASAHASFGSFGPWEGAALLLVFGLTLAYGFMVDLAVLVKAFRHRAAVVVALIVTLAVVLLLASLAASPPERAGFFKVFPSGSGPVVFALTSAVLIPFLFVAPIAQYQAMRDGRPSPAWLTLWMTLQPSLLPVFVILAFTNHYYWQGDYAAGIAEGRGARAGELGAMVEQAEQRRERIWGTGWTYPSRDPASAWALGMAIGMDESALIATDEPLGASDRAALRTLVDRHLRSYAVPHVRAKLLWDTLEPGSFSATLDPRLVYEETVPVLLERLEEYGEARLCPGRRMMDADRAALDALILAKGRAYAMRPPWDDYQQRGQRLCPGPG
jgi:hypothetical protein